MSRGHSTPSLPRGAVLLSPGCPLSSVPPWGPRYRRLGGVSSRYVLPLRSGGGKTEMRSQQGGFRPKAARRGLPQPPS